MNNNKKNSIKSCNAKRGGNAYFVLRINKFKLPIKLTFMGVGSAEFQKEINLNELPKSKKLKMDWIWDIFIGKHWLLGKFIIDLNPKIKSYGEIIPDDINKGWFEATNINYFYFRFSFPDFFNLEILNNDPIINSSKINNIPPFGSVYKLDDIKKEINIDLIKGKNRLEKSEIKFDYCDVTIYPEENIKMKIENIEKKDNYYSISINYYNLTNSYVEMVYFIVLHDNRIIAKNDSGIKKIKPNKTLNVKFIVSSNTSGFEIELPIYGGIYKPEKLRGSCDEYINLKF